MPNGHDIDPVSYGRWEAAHAALEQRLVLTEQRLTEQIRELDERLDDLTRNLAESVAKRRDRQWTLMIAFLTGLALPLLVLAVVALASSHLH